MEDKFYQISEALVQTLAERYQPDSIDGMDPKSLIKAVDELSWIRTQAQIFIAKVVAVERQITDALIQDAMPDGDVNIIRKILVETEVKNLDIIQLASENEKLRQLLNRANSDLDALKDDIAEVIGVSRY